MRSQDLSASLQQFDKRTIELFMVRADKSHPPDHLSDRRIAGLMETNGRERRHRYFTLLNYQKLVSQEALDQSSAGYEETVKSGVGGFFPQDASGFYEDEASLAAYQDSFNIDDGMRLVKKTKKRKFKNPMLPDGTVKKGRPTKKHQQSLNTNAVASTSKVVEVAEVEPPPSASLSYPTLFLLSFAQNESGVDRQKHRSPRQFFKSKSPHKCLILYLKVTLVLVLLRSINCLSQPYGPTVPTLLLPMTLLYLQRKLYERPHPLIPCLEPSLR